MEPRDLDVVRLMRALPEHDLPAGSEGTVVNDYQRHDVPRTYLVVTGPQELVHFWRESTMGGCSCDHSGLALESS
jgi:hypothetical protein